jgi:Arc/MetJ-type ribon-helix-helix transcriptional regulator
MSKVRDRKITVSLAADLADAVDKHVEEHPQETNRSKVIEEALRLWELLHQFGEVQTVLEEAMALYKKERERELYRSYYADLTEEARAEAQGWRQIGEETASRRARAAHKPEKPA